MLYWIFQISIISLIIILLLHHLINYFIKTLTVPKTRDLVTSTSEKYKDIYNIISNTNTNATNEIKVYNKNININTNTNTNTNTNFSNNLNDEIEIKDFNQIKENNNMKNDLKDFFRNQIIQDSSTSIEELNIS